MVASPSQRSRQARIAALTRWSQQDGREGTEARREASPASLTYWERQVDPDGTLDEQERRKRAERAQKAYFLKLAQKSVLARQKKASSS